MKTLQILFSLAIISLIAFILKAFNYQAPFDKQYKQTIELLQEQHGFDSVSKVLASYPALDTIEQKRQQMKRSQTALLTADRSPITTEKAESLYLLQQRKLLKQLHLEVEKRLAYFLMNELKFIANN